MLKKVTLRFNASERGFEVFDDVTGALAVRICYILSPDEEDAFYELRTSDGELLVKGSRMTQLLAGFFGTEIDVKFADS